MLFYLIVTSANFTWLHIRLSLIRMTNLKTVFFLNYSLPKLKFIKIDEIEIVNKKDQCIIKSEIRFVFKKVFEYQSNFKENLNTYV